MMDKQLRKKALSIGFICSCVAYVITIYLINTKGVREIAPTNSYFIETFGVLGILITFAAFWAVVFTFREKLIKSAPYVCFYISFLCFFDMLNNLTAFFVLSLGLAVNLEKGVDPLGI